VLQGKIRRLIVNLPPRHLKSHLASVNLPAHGTVQMSQADAAPLLRAGWVYADTGG
jgi:hypothetical protein